MAMSDVSLPFLAGLEAKYLIDESLLVGFGLNTIVNYYDNYPKNYLAYNFGASAKLAYNLKRRKE